MTNSKTRIVLFIVIKTTVGTAHPTNYLTVNQVLVSFRYIHAA